ncbi:MAG: Gfo/Idh/MocA family oxidoreductase [Thermoguttaceae bacterium]|nr:Gfo/Idh/MocA family oxidoreductase [Thermoguttaceae bacterium]
MSSSQTIPRRSFLAGGLAAAAGVAAPYVFPASVLAAPGRAGANDRINLAWIGVGRRAHQMHGDLGSAPSVPGEARVVAVADVYLEKCRLYIEAYREKVLRGEEGGPIAVYQEYRKILDRDDIDAVMVPTPEHWRALPCIHACQAGKDVFAEKPLSLTIREGRAMVQAARKYNRVFQVGTQQRSTPRNYEATQLLRNGRLGKITDVVCQRWASSRPYADFDIPAEPIPEGMDWDTWCGQTEPVPYNERVYLTYNNPGWHNLRRYSGGNLANSGSHALDIVQWGLGTDDTGPVEVWAESAHPGARLTYRYANGVKLHIGFPPELLEKTASGELQEPEEKPSAFGAIFYGERGRLVEHRGRFNTIPIALSQEPLPADAVPLYESKHHFQNWIDCIKSREKPAADVEIGHRTCSVCQLGGIARELGRKLTWDPEKEIFPGDDEANAYLERPQRKPFQLPEVI